MSKTKGVYATCLFCKGDKTDYRAEIIGRHYLSKHRIELLQTKTFVEALKRAVKQGNDTVCWLGKDYCFTCGARFQTPAIQANAYTEERLAEMKQSAIIKHFVKNKSHSENNKKIHEALLKEALELEQSDSGKTGGTIQPGSKSQSSTYGIEVPQLIPQSHLEEIAKLKKQIKRTEQDVESQRKRAEDKEFSIEGFEMAVDKIFKMFYQAYNFSEEQKEDTQSYLEELRSIYFNLAKGKLDTQDAEEMIDELETPNLLQVSPQNTLHTPETESLENAYKYGYMKDSDQHSDGVYEGEVDIEPWMKSRF